MENLPLRLDVFFRCQATVLGLRMPGAKGFSAIAVGNEHIDVDRVPRLQLRNHLNERIYAPLRQTGRPFLGIDHIVHVIALHLYARHQQVSALIFGKTVVSHVLVPQGAVPVRIHHVEVQADGRVVLPAFADQPSEARESGGIVWTLETRVDLAPGRITVVVPALLPTHQVNDLGDSARQVVGLANDFERFFEGAKNFVAFPKGRIIGQALHRLAFHAEEQLQHQRLMVVAVEWAHDHVGARLELPAVSSNHGLDGGNTAFLGNDLSVLEDSHGDTAAGDLGFDRDRGLGNRHRLLSAVGVDGREGECSEKVRLGCGPENLWIHRNNQVIHRCFRSQSGRRDDQNRHQGCGEFRPGRHSHRVEFKS